MKEFTILSPAKINLNLRVTCALAGGMHEIESVVQPVDIFDEVRIEMTGDSGVTLETNTPVCPPEENTAFTAAKLFFEKSGVRAGARIFLNKKIPAGAGLGGGSGNAAAVLVCLNRATGAFSSRALRELARKTGSDVSLFIDCETCRVSGAGEKTEPLKQFPLLFYVVCFPGFPSQTADVYRKWDGLAASPARAGGKKMWNISPPLEMVNDLEPPAFALYPDLARFCGRLEADSGAAFRMTGSGSAFFSVFEDETNARAVFDIVNSGDFDCFLARGINGWKGKGGGEFASGL